MHHRNRKSFCLLLCWYLRTAGGCISGNERGALCFTLLHSNLTTVLNPSFCYINPLKDLRNKVGPKRCFIHFKTDIQYIVRWLVIRWIHEQQLVVWFENFMDECVTFIMGSLMAFTFPFFFYGPFSQYICLEYVFLFLFCLVFYVYCLL